MIELRTTGLQGCRDPRIAAVPGLLQKLAESTQPPEALAQLEAVLHLLHMDRVTARYNWMRDYDPTTGRYIQADPLGLIPGPSLYGYAYQSPLR